MGRYFFHLEAAKLWLDEEGTELPDIAAAKGQAVQYIAEHLHRKPNHFWEADNFEVRVTDSNDLTLFLVAVIATLSPAISNTPGSADHSVLATVGAAAMTGNRTKP